MKIILKILCAPVIAVLSVFIWLAAKLVQVSAIFLLTPYSLPMQSIILLGKVQRFKCWIQDRIYGQALSSCSAYK